MNTAQSEALDKASEILGEHFGSFVIVVGWEDDGDSYSTNGSWGGGVPAAIGLCSLYHAKLVDLHLHGSSEDEQ